MICSLILQYLQGNSILRFIVWYVSWHAANSPGNPSELSWFSSTDHI